MTDDEGMPAPPDLSDLYKQQTRELSEAQSAALSSFDVFQQRNTQVSELVAAYEAEITQVFLIAKAVQNPVMAIASVPLVLAAANTALSKASVTKNSITALIDAQFAPFK